MAELKTRKNDGDVDEFLASIADARRRADALAVRELMASVTGDRGSMWGDSIVGFGEAAYTSGSGKESRWFTVGFSPRKQSLTLYIMPGFDEFQSLLDRLGPHSTGKSCLYVKRLDAVDEDVLRELVAESVARMEQRDEAWRDRALRP